jgi:phosphatidylinositol glycan class K
VRRLGLPDDRIVLMLADDHAWSAKNPRPGAVYHADAEGAASRGTPGSEEDGGAGASDAGNLYAPRPEVDYTGADVTPDAILRVLTGRHEPGTPASRRLRAGRSSRLLLYLTGHGGDGFLKLHDKEELAAGDVADALATAAAAGRFTDGGVLALLDTCQASTLAEPMRTPGTIALASSVRDENSYAYGHDAGALARAVRRNMELLHA